MRFLKALHARFTIACPAFRRIARSVYSGPIFLRPAPGALRFPACVITRLDAMTDSNLVRVLGRQTKAKVGPCPITSCAKARPTIRKAFSSFSMMA